MQTKTLIQAEKYKKQKVEGEVGEKKNKRIFFFIYYFFYFFTVTQASYIYAAKDTDWIQKMQKYCANSCA